MSSSQHQYPTPYPEVNQLLNIMLENAREILHEKLVGFYLYGSLSLGDFDPGSSDIDFLIVTTEELDEQILGQLHAMHIDIATSKLIYAKRLEGSYIPLRALRSYDPENAIHPTIGTDWDFGLGRHGSNWILERHVVREYGVTVWGPAPKTLIDPVSAQELRVATCDALMGFWKQQLETPDWLHPRNYQAFAALTMCRALYTLTHAEVSSKPKAAAWALQAIDARWHPIIERALLWQYQHEDDDLAETLAFIQFAIMYSENICTP